MADSEILPDPCQVCLDQPANPVCAVYHIPGNQPRTMHNLCFATCRRMVRLVVNYVRLHKAKPYVVHGLVNR